MNAALTASERLEIEQACTRLAYIYVRALDSHDADTAADCFALHGSMTRPMQPEQVIEGREAIRASLKSRPRSLLTRHLAGNVVIDVESRDAAGGITTLVMIGCTPPEGELPPHASNGPLYFGEFRDRFVRESGEWKFLERRGSIAIKY